MADEFDMRFTLTDDSPQRALVMVSRLGHCLNDLIFRWRAGSPGAELVAVVSNHEDLRPMTEVAGLPFFHLSRFRRSGPRWWQPSSGCPGSPKARHRTALHPYIGAGEMR